MLHNVKKKIFPFVLSACVVLGAGQVGFSFTETKTVETNEASSDAIAAMFKDPGIAEASSSVNIISLTTGTPIYQNNINKALAPASNMKVLTSAAALTLLKPEYTFSTSVYADSSVSASVVNGNLYLKGSGDPDLTAERLWAMVRELKNRGVKEIKGDLVADDTFFDELETGEGWKVQSYGAVPYAARISALSLNHNTVNVWIRPGGKAGEKAVVTLEPPNSFFEIQNSAVTGGGYPDVLVTRDKAANGKNLIIVKGRINQGSPAQPVTVNLDNPALYTAHVFKELMKNEGIVIRGTVRKGKTPASAYEFVISKSRPLSAIVYDFNKHSINLTGELLLKHLGATFRGQPGTAKKGADVIKKEFLEKKLRISTESLIIADGSGLSPLNRITTHHFVNVLKYMYDNFGLRGDFLASLPVSGADGTLRKRTRNTPGERNVRAKTGFINGVSALSGYTLSKDGKPIAFSIIMNNFRSYYAATSIQDSIGIYLSSTNLNR